MTKINKMMEQVQENIKAMSSAELEKMLDASTDLKDGKQIPVSAWAWYKYAVEKELKKRRTKRSKTKR